MFVPGGIIQLFLSAFDMVKFVVNECSRITVVLWDEFTSRSVFWA